MALPININTLLKGKVVEWERLDFKKGWNPADVLHTACAFANDVNNWGGGYIVVGIEEVKGTPVLPPVGLDILAIDEIQQKLLNLVHMIEPTPVVIAEPVTFMDKTILVIWVPGGELRPYKAPEDLGKEALKKGKRYYIRKGSVTCIARGEDERHLLALASKVPFDDRICHQASEKDLNLLLIRDYLRKIESGISDDEACRMPFSDLCWSLQLVGGPSEYTRPKNFALLFFCDNPEKYIPYARLETVRFFDEVGDRFEENIFHGPLHIQYKKVMDYLESNVITEKVIKVPNQAEALRAFNYPYSALEEVVANAVYHKSYDDRNPIEIRINPDSIQVYSLEGPVPPIRANDLKKQRVVSRNYRNRRIGDILKDLDITEGRSTGFPKVYNAMRKNGSPDPIFETDENNLYFLATIPIHPAFLEESAQEQPQDQSQNQKESKSQAQAQEVSKGQDQVKKQNQEKSQKKIRSLQLKILEFCKRPKTLEEILNKFGYKDKYGFKKKYIDPLLGKGLAYTSPEHPRNKDQKYVSIALD
ncbi:MAG: putative DNA binding domain-containing protein [Bacteroidales bacterium]|nr:putative DNA binding domain-containing protein [Bacteroidales bacterium]